MMINDVSEAAAPTLGAHGRFATLGLLEGESANDHLRELVIGSALPPAVAMTVFNRGLGAGGCTETQWKGFLADSDSPKFVPLPEAWLAHAIEQFARIGVRREFS